MKPNDLSFNLVERQKSIRLAQYDSKKGITERLLEKYKPSKGLRIVNGSKGALSEKRAA